MTIRDRVKELLTVPEVAKRCGLGYWRTWRIVSPAPRGYGLVPRVKRDDEGGEKAAWLLDAEGIREVQMIASVLDSGATMQEVRGIAKAIHARGANPFSRGRFSVEVKGRRGRIVRAVSEAGRVHSEILSFKGGFKRLLSV
jgi:hypothetical protein